MDCIQTTTDKQLPDLGSDRLLLDLGEHARLCSDLHHAAVALTKRYGTLVQIRQDRLEDSEREYSVALHEEMLAAELLRRASLAYSQYKATGGFNAH